MDCRSCAKSPGEAPSGAAVALGGRTGRPGGGGTPWPRPARSLPQEEALEPPPGRRGGGVTGNGAPRAASAALGRSGSRPPCCRRPRGREEECDNPIKKRSTSPVGTSTPRRAETVGRSTPRLAPTGVSAPGPSLENGA